MSIIPVIISGGAGSRLWPLSREKLPKPFVELPQGGTLAGRTYKRATSLDGVECVYTMTNRDFLFLTAEVAEASKNNLFLLEPEGRGTAAAVALATLKAASTYDNDVNLLILPADHLVRDEKAFSEAVDEATELANEKNIVTFGIQPKWAETGYGYIETEGNKVLGFKEKPDLDIAASYMKSGRHYWNSGMFLFQAGAMLDAMQRYCPEIIDGARVALGQAKKGKHGSDVVLEITSEPFAQIPSTSIDYAVMEKAADVACVPVDCGWSDVGSWLEMSKLLNVDEDDNYINGNAEVVSVESKNCLVHSNGRVVGLVDVSDLVVVDTADAMLVAKKDSAQKVNEIFKRLKAMQHDVVTFPSTVHRPWGKYTVLEEGAQFKVKCIEVKPGEQLSLQAHNHRSEHWVIVSGAARVRNGEKEFHMGENQSTFIPSGHKHRLENPGKEPLVLIEVQTGDYLGEDDIVRFEDNYGRV